jgi:UDP-N-acetylglucosamine--N-acetylmuramyl-(pentapeptide) pyrophosphoryl-undecaprenol N-acetylglucosamine transferase
LGARTINRSVIAHLNKLANEDIQVIWQTGKFYFTEAQKAAETYKSVRLIVTDFVTRMDYAYAIADLVVSRAGASSVSELCLLAKPAILVPSPNVAEDHQTKNAMALVNKQAALLVTDKDAEDQLIDIAIKTIHSEALLNQLEKNISELAEHNSADRIAEIIINVAASANKKK